MPRPFGALQKACRIRQLHGGVLGPMKLAKLFIISLVLREVRKLHSTTNHWGEFLRTKFMIHKSIMNLHYQIYIFYLYLYCPSGGINPCLTHLNSYVQG